MKKIKKATFKKPLETFAKAFISITLTLYLVELQKGHNLFSGDWEMFKTILTGGMVSTLPILINWLNPHYAGYGKKK